MSDAPSPDSGPDSGDSNPDRDPGRDIGRGRHAAHHTLRTVRTFVIVGILAFVTYRSVNELLRIMENEGPVSTETEQLIDTLQRPEDEAARQAALDRLRELGPQAAENILLEAMAGDTQERFATRREALLVMGEDAIPALRAVLRDPQAGSLGLALATLDEVPDPPPEAFAEAQVHAREERGSYREPALKVLATWPGPRGRGLLLTWLTAEDPPWPRRRVIRHLLERDDVADDAEALAGLQGALPELEGEQRERTLTLLAGEDDSLPSGALLVLLQQAADGDTAAVAVACSYLDDAPLSALHLALLQQLAADDRLEPEQRTWIRQVLARSPGGAQVLEDLVVERRDPASLRLLLELDHPLEPLLERLRAATPAGTVSDDVELLRMAGARAEPLLPWLEELLRGDEQAAWPGAADCLAAVGTPAAARVLVEVVHEAPGRRADCALQALCEQSLGPALAGDAEALGWLEELSQHRANSQTAALALTLLRQAERAEDEATAEEGSE